ncbi:MAG: Rossmann-like and DUF2520 domain-containing protein [Bacteroidales bacterium]
MVNPTHFPGHIIIAGAGNVGTHLAVALHKAGIQISQIYSRTRESASELAKQVGCGFTTNPADIDRLSGMLLLTLSDSAIESFLREAGKLKMMLVHTAGSVPMEVLRPFGEQFGVMYPLQTFTRGVPVEWSEVPFLTEASDEEGLAYINFLASRLSPRVLHMSSEDRLRYHLAAVFCNNFSNHMMTLADDWLRSQGLSFGILEPLVKETARKAVTAGPAKAQTGPATRDNKALLELHQRMLKDFPDLQKMYTFVSDSIRKKYSSEEKDSQ